ncbi:MAG: hypothetical protein KJN76_00695 [Eudoraea sp.]|nr:hypothetical protein [Eudoraea sp.]
MKQIIFYSILASCLVTGLKAHAQLPDCTLGIGGKDTDVLVQVFQLNQEQTNTLDIWLGELQTKHKLTEDQIKLLFEKHPQSTQEDLETLAKKYKVLKDEMMATSKKYDQKLLGLFNPKQYQRYVDLCTEALRQPITPIAEVQLLPNPEDPE